MKLLCAILCMTSATILAAVEDYLAPLVLENKGLVSIAETEEDALEELSVAPERWRVVLCMDGDKGIDDLNPAGLVEARLVVYVQAPKGMEAVRNRSMVRESFRGTPSFFTRLHWLIRKLRGLSLVATDIDSTGLRYRGWDWLRYDGQAAFRTAKASFDLVFAHDDPATDPEGTELIVLPSPFRIVAAAEGCYVIAVSGTAHGRVPRYEPGEDDPTGTATGYAITSSPDECYTVAFDGVPHGRIPRYAPV
jgi:hypothetical protein